LIEKPDRTAAEALAKRARLPQAAVCRHSIKERLNTRFLMRSVIIQFIVIGIFAACHPRWRT
jgi:hypothetical protein